ncbi:hypothetical protein NBT05_07375 [Aquimarina sp. ERC-38]|uniref:hypothetical protein n=1 Tax=Aquimarina sp. ERC-38 TaxID=2949996 RepID=UPI0022476094|nr:hypothetical protein [Aquimarina sp. ERC-38]UZO82288.1 hypothetical protein NBT05_07375 [Aquimarina sp. ERC-38]
MKYIKNIIAVFLLIIVVIGCQEESTVARDNAFTALGFTTSFGAGVNKQTTVNQFESFMDLSSGATRHEWRIPEGAFFLRGPIPNQVKIFDPFIINPGTTVSTDRTVHVLFKDGSSSTKVTLYNEFADSLAFQARRWNPADSTVVDTLTRTIRMGDKWVYEYELNLDVYDTIVPEMRIRDINGVNIDLQSTDVINLSQGDQLIFEDLRSPSNNARPDLTTFRITSRNPFEVVYDSEEMTSAIDTITFDAGVGEFTGLLISKRDPTDNLAGDTQRFEIPVIFNVR